MENLKIEKLMDNMVKELGENVDFLARVGSGYITDIIHEQADLSTEIYTNELLDIVSDLYHGDYIYRAVSELGADAKDFTGLLMLADYLRQADNYYNVLEDAKVYYILDRLYQLDITDITSKHLEDIEAVKTEDIDTIDNLEDFINEILDC